MNMVAHTTVSQFMQLYYIILYWYYDNFCLSLTGLNGLTRYILTVD